MTSPMFTSTGEAPRVVRIEALAFHDAAGRIHHMHHHVVLEGAVWDVRRDRFHLDDGEL